GSQGTWTGARLADGLELRREDRAAARRRVRALSRLAEASRAARARAPTPTRESPRGAPPRGRRARRRREGRAGSSAVGRRDPARALHAPSRPHIESARRVTHENRNRGASGLVGVFGGTFDPVHLGHLRIALELLERTGL